jgi:hypothetical protein
MKSAGRHEKSSAKSDKVIAVSPKNLFQEGVKNEIIETYRMAPARLEPHHRRL